MDPTTEHLLQQIFRRESRSFLQYISDSFPWVSEEEQPALAQVRALAQAESQAIADLGRFLSRHRVTPPFLGSYPMSFTTKNFVSLEHLLPLLAEDQTRGLRQLESNIASLQNPEARFAVERLVERKRSTLEALQSLTAVTPARASTVR